MPETDEQINHPSHYGGEDNPYEAIKIIEAMGDGPGFCRGNALKYLTRAGKKEGESELKDYGKVAWYADRLVRQICESKSIYFQLEQFKADFNHAAGELLVAIPEPGTDASKLLAANILLRDVNQSVRDLCREYQEKNHGLKSALSELVALKRMKDREVKTEEYLHRQPLAWERAEQLVGGAE